MLRWKCLRPSIVSFSHSYMPFPRPDIIAIAPRRIAMIALYVLILSVSIASVFHYHNAIGGILWKYLKLETIPLTLSAEDATMLFEMGDHHFGGAGRYDIETAQKYYIRALQQRYAFPEAHYQLGRTYFIQSRFREAIFEIKEAIRYAPDLKQGYYMYGLINGYQENYPEAEWGFKEFIKRDDFNWAGYNDLAWVYFRQGDYEKTRDTAAAGLRHAEVNPWLHTIYGTALLNLGDKTGAKTAFESAWREVSDMTPESWGASYPGNDPGIYARGLEEMRSVIRHNLSLVDTDENNDPQEKSD